MLSRFSSFVQCFLRLFASMAKPWHDHILIQQVCSFSISRSKFNINKAIPLWYSILTQKNSSQKNKTQKLPILHLVRDVNPWHLEFTSRDLFKPAPICMDIPLSPVIAFLVPVSNPGSPYLHMEGTSGFEIFFGSPWCSSIILYPQYSSQYFLLRPSS